MKEQIEKIRQEYEEISAELNRPDIFSDAKKMGELGKRQAELSETMENINALERIVFNTDCISSNVIFFIDCIFPII